VRTAVALATAVLALAACGGDDDGPTRPQLDAIAPAVAAVEAELGGPQRYFEITAEPQRVELWVALDDATAAVPYVYIGGELAPAAASQPASGETFAPGDAPFDPDTVLDQLDEDLDEPDIAQLSIGRNTAGEVDLLVVVQSAQGGVLDVTLAPDGTVRSVEPRTPP
jgi:hypothetical protein